MIFISPQEAFEQKRRNLIPAHTLRLELVFLPKKRRFLTLKNCKESAAHL